MIEMLFTLTFFTVIPIKMIDTETIWKKHWLNFERRIVSGVVRPKYPSRAIYFPKNQGKTGRGRHLCVPSQSRFY